MNRKSSSYPKPGWLLRLHEFFQHGDRPWQVLIITVSILVIVLMAAIGWMLWSESSGARLAFGWGFLALTNNASWDPVMDHFQAWPFIYGSLLTSLIAIFLALPISLGLAIFLVELCPAWMNKSAYEASRTTGSAEMPVPEFRNVAATSGHRPKTMYRSPRFIST